MYLLIEESLCSRCPLGPPLPCSWFSVSFPLVFYFHLRRNPPNDDSRGDGGKVPRRSFLRSNVTNEIRARSPITRMMFAHVASK